jgi:hypothetical protein
MLRLPARFGKCHLPPITAYPWISILASGTASAVMVIRALPGKLSPNTSRRICVRRSTRRLRSVASWRHLPTIAPQSRQKMRQPRYDPYQCQPRRSCLREAGRFSSLVFTNTRIGIRCSGPADASPTSKMNSRRLILCPSEVLTSIVSAPTSFKEGRSGLRRGSSVSFESFSDLGPRAELGQFLPQHRTWGAGTGESEKCRFCCRSRQRRRRGSGEDEAGDAVVCHLLHREADNCFRCTWAMWELRKGAPVQPAAVAPKAWRAA